MEHTNYPIIDTDGNVERVAVYSRDVTEKKNMEEEIKRTREEFITIFAHDLRSPLSVIMGCAQIIVEPIYGEISREKIKQVDMIKNAVNYLLTLINNIIEVSQIESGATKYIFEEFLLEELLNEIKDMFAIQADSKKIVFDVSEVKDCWVKADRNKLRQIFHNLINNALRYTEAGGRININAQKRGEMVVINVSDTGYGIPESEQGRLFQKFTQINDEKRGSGLGLYIVKKFLEGHNSNISLISEQGSGSRFTFSLSAGKSPRV